MCFGSEANQPGSESTVGEDSEGIAASSGSENNRLAPVKRAMSASARRKIAAAQRARWAKLKKAA